MKRPPQPVIREDQILIDRLYTLEEAAAFFNLESSHWLRERIRTGELAYVDLNPNGERPKYRVRASAINDLIDLYSIGTTPPPRTLKAA